MRLNFVQNTFKYTMEATFLNFLFVITRKKSSQFLIFIRLKSSEKKSREIVHVQTSYHDLIKIKISRPIALALTASNHMFKVHYWLLRSYNQKSFKRFELHFKTFFFIFFSFLHSFYSKSDIFENIEKRLNKISITVQNN